MFGKRDDGTGEVRTPLLGEKLSFDELTRGVASGTISRGRALKLAGAAVLGAALVPFSAAPAEARKKNLCKGNSDACTSETATRCKGATCACLTDTKGKLRCVDLARVKCPERDECNKNKDCAKGEVCLQLGGPCCGGPNNLCLPKCK